MWREADRTMLAFVGDNAKTIEVTETPEQLLEQHFGSPGKA